MEDYIFEVPDLPLDFAVGHIFVLPEAEPHILYS